MITIRDLLKDFAHVIHTNTQVDAEGQTYIITKDEDEIVDEYIEIIKERIVG